MKRDLYQKLLEWKGARERKPLILRGARQVGKTYLIKEFARSEYAHFVSFNFDEDPDLHSLFDQKLTPESLIKKLEIYSEQKIHSENTLIFFDEIQECPRALTSLKYFCEKANAYPIIAAGSLLGLKLGPESSFPVGKVNFLDLYPFSFFEFLDAIQKSFLRKYLEEKSNFDPIEEGFHNQLLDFLKQYFVIGGMPEVVHHFIENQDFQKIRSLQKEILDTYELDFAKHAQKSEVMKISLIWNSVPNQLAKENKKFIFSKVKESVRSRDYEDAIQWLCDAGLIYKSFHTSTPKLPLGAYVNRNIFKIYTLDVGLLGCQVRLDPKILLEQNKLFVEYKGALTENFIAQELVRTYGPHLYYWTSSGMAEVDFLLEDKGGICPLEVKGGVSRHKKSLRAYGDKYKPEKLLRTTSRNFKWDGNLVNYPLYAVCLFSSSLTMFLRP